MHCFFFIQAAEAMRRCHSDGPEAARRTRAGKALIEARHSPAVVGERYRRRLADLALVDGPIDAC